MPISASASGDPIRRPGTFRSVSLVLAPLWAGLAAALSVAVPFVGILLLPMAAARLGRALLATRGAFAGFLAASASVAAALVLGLFVGPGGSIAAVAAGTALVALPALAIFVGARDGRRRDHLFLLVFALTGIGGLGVVLAVAVATGLDPGTALTAALERGVADAAGLYRSAGVPESSLAALSRAAELGALALREVLPGLVLAGAALHAALVVYVFGGVAGLRERGLAAPSFSRFSTPVAAAALFVPAGLVAAVGPEVLRGPAIDLLLPLLVLFFLRGLAIIRALLDKGRAGLFGRALVYATVFLMPLFAFVLVLGGLFDEFLDVRGRLDRFSASGSAGGSGGG